MGHFLCGVERLKRFVNVHLHCIVSNLKRISKISTLSSVEKFLRTPVLIPMLYLSLIRRLYLSLILGFT